MCTLLRKDKLSHILKNPANWWGFYIHQKMIEHILTTKISNSYQLPLEISIGVFFLIVGVTMIYILPAQVGFIFTDLMLAYIPMGYLG